MKKVKLIWYDMNEEILVEYMEVEKNTTYDEIVNRAYKKYGGKNTPGPMLSISDAEEGM